MRFDSKNSPINKRTTVGSTPQSVLAELQILSFISAQMTIRTLAPTSAQMMLPRMAPNDPSLIELARSGKL